MNDEIYTVGLWRVKKGLEQEFIKAWKELSDIFMKLPLPPSGKGILVQSVTDSTLFYSFGPWDSAESVQAMRTDPHAQAGMARVRDLCTEAAPGSYRVAATS